MNAIVIERGREKNFNFIKMIIVKNFNFGRKKDFQIIKRYSTFVQDCLYLGTCMAIVKVLSWPFSSSSSLQEQQANIPPLSFFGLDIYRKAQKTLIALVGLQH